MNDIDMLYTSRSCPSELYKFLAYQVVAGLDDESDIDQIQFYTTYLIAVISAQLDLRTQPPGPTYRAPYWPPAAHHQKKNTNNLTTSEVIANKADGADDSSPQPAADDGAADDGAADDGVADNGAADDTLPQSTADIDDVALPDDPADDTLL